MILLTRGSSINVTCVIDKLFLSLAVWTLTRWLEWCLSSCLTMDSNNHCMKMKPVERTLLHHLCAHFFVISRVEYLKYGGTE